MSKGRTGPSYREALLLKNHVSNPILRGGGMHPPPTSALQDIAHPFTRLDHLANYLHAKFCVDRNFFSFRVICSVLHLINFTLHHFTCVKSPKKM